MRQIGVLTMRGMDPTMVLSATLGNTDLCLSVPPIGHAPPRALLRVSTPDTGAAGWLPWGGGRSVGERCFPRAQTDIGRAIR